MQDPSPPPVSDNVLGRYRLSTKIGAGGMGTVFEARDILLQRRVAIKLLAPEVQSDHVARERLRGEALAAASLDHPFICKIYELGETDDRLFVVMEFVDGQTLHALAAQALLPMRQIVDIATEIAEALDEAHRHGLVHRDLKPSNIMLTAQGHVKVMDFGLAKQVTPRADHASATATALTDAGMRVGTPGYMSPEQVLGGSLDPRSDIFSLGVVLYELTAGLHPFTREDSAQTMAAILRDPPSGGARDLESLPGLAALVHRMLAKACAERPQSMRELRVELESLRERAWTSGASSGRVAAPEPLADRTPFVGRGAETAELWRLLDRMLTGQGGSVLIGGEPGVGKTRLAQELMKVAWQRGCVCLIGHCYEMEGAPPFVPFVEMVEESVRLVPRAVRIAMAEEAPEIASIVPSLRRIYDDIPPMPELPADQRRRLVFNAVLEYMRRAAQKSPSVLLLDDLHWADEPTLQLLTHLVPHLSSMRTLIVGTYRDVELDVGRPFAKTLEALLRQRLATRISLRRLDEPGVTDMLSALAGSAPPSGLAEAVFHETEGNPFFVEEVYHHLAEEGKLFEPGGQWKADLRLGTIEVPEGVRLVVGRRLDRLGEQARKVLTAAAVIGRTFPLDLLRTVVDSSEDTVLDALEEAERAQLVAIDPRRRAVRYSFVHELIRTTLTNALSLPRRQRLHLRIADALEQSQTFHDGQPSVLAHHLYQAGAAADARRTGAALAAAGRAADAAGAFEEALEIFDNLLTLELPEQDPLVAETFERRGNALGGLQRHDEAASSFERALALYTAVHDDPGIARSAQMASASLVWRARFDETIAIVDRGLHALSERAAAERAFLRSRLGAWMSQSPSRIDEAWTHIEGALAIAEQLENPALLADVLLSKSVAQRLSGEYGPALATGLRGLPLAPADAPWRRADFLWTLVTVTYYMGRFPEAATFLDSLEPVARRAGHHGALWLHDRVVSAIALARSGDLRAYFADCERMLPSPQLPYVSKTFAAVARLYLGKKIGHSTSSPRLWPSSRKNTSSPTCRRPTCSPPRRSSDATARPGR
ncbi:MAG: serine/threonine-protein kinase [Acidobacteriota bacterium]